MVGIIGFAVFFLFGVRRYSAAFDFRCFDVLPLQKTKANVAVQHRGLKRNKTSLLCGVQEGMRASR
jgi:hypothetical protein